MITSEMIVCRIKSDFAIMCTFTWQFKHKKEQQSFIISLLLVWNSFIITLNLSRNYGQVSAVVILAAMLSVPGADGGVGAWEKGEICGQRMRHGSISRYKWVCEIDGYTIHTHAVGDWHCYKQYLPSTQRRNEAADFLSTTGHYLCLQCFDAVGWAAGRASGL